MGDLLGHECFLSIIYTMDTRHLVLVIDFQRNNERVDIYVKNVNQKSCIILLICKLFLSKLHLKVDLHIKQNEFDV